MFSTDPNLDVYHLWWEEKNQDAAARYMVGVADRIYESQAEVDRRNQHLLHAKLFANQDLDSIYDCRAQKSGLAGIYLSVNVTESCANTLSAKMTRTRVRPSIMTERGSRRLQRSAEQATDFIDGVYHASELHEAEGEQMFTDGELFGSGIAYTCDDGDGGIVVERVLPQELVADEQEAVTAMRWRSLQTLYRHKYMHREALYRMRGDDGKMFGDDPVKREAIRKSQVYMAPGATYGSFGDATGQMVRVRFGWRLPSKRGAGDGRYMVAIDGCRLYSKVWTRMRFPFDLFTFQRRPVGIWGRSLAEQLVPIQLKINDLLEIIDQGQNLNARVNLLYQDGAIDPEDLDNGFGRLIKLATGHTVAEVRELVGTGASKEMYEDLETWIRRGYEITGISMLSATAEKPEGITSAVALRELLDREDLRFSALGKRWERFHRDIGETILDTAEEMGGKVTVQVQGDKWVKNIKFEDLKFDRRRSAVTVAAASALPTTPAARKQYADDLLTRGAITMDRYLEIIDESGDVRGVTSMVTAIQESIDLDVEDILEDAKWRAPDKLRDPALARDTAIAAYAKATHEDVPAKNLEMLRRYIMLATRMASTEAAPQQAAQQGAAAEQAGQAPPQPAPSNGTPPPADLAAAAPTPVPPVQPVQQ